MQYALLIYNPDDDVAGQAQREMDPGIAAALERPEVAGFIRLHAAGSATTVHYREGGTLLTDGPFIDSKEFLGGVILIDADNLDEALALACELTEVRPGCVVAIEVRPVREAPVREAPVREQEISGA